MTALVVDPRTLQALQLKLTATLARAGEEHRMTMYAVHRTVTRIDAAVTSRKARVQQCEQALRACQESDRSDCSHESAALVEAQRRLGSALHARAVAAQAATDYGSRSRASLRRLEDIDAEGQRYLRFKLDRVNAVTAGGSSPRGGSGPATTSPGASAVGAGAVHAAPGLPAGFAMVPVALIDQTENPIHGPQDFTKGYSIEDLDYAFDLLETQVLPGLSAGSDSSAFAAADRAAGSFGRRSLSDTFSGFFGGDAIRLEQRPDGTYSITNGRHRIFVASRFGRPFVPARIVGGRP